MHRRDFLKYSAVTTTTVIFPQLVQSNEFSRLVKMAWYCSKLNPVRFVAGLIFDEVKEIFLKPLGKSAFNHFLYGGVVYSSSLSSYSRSSSAVTSPSISHEAYKASIVVYGVADYQKYKEEQIKLELQRSNDIERFEQIVDYMAQNHFKLKLYNTDKTILVGKYFEPNDLFNIDYISVKNQNIHIKQLLKETSNKSFSGLVV